MLKNLYRIGYWGMILLLVLLLAYFILPIEFSNDMSKEMAFRILLFTGPSFYLLTLAKISFTKKKMAEIVSEIVMGIILASLRFVDED